MFIIPDYLNYQRSISNELISEKNRVRDLIGNVHFGEDGRYKEIILREIISKKLPSIAAVGTGFAAGNELSRQIDIIIYRNDIPLIFKESDFVIVPKEAVLGIIEVKTRWESFDFCEVFEKAHKNGEIIGSHIFNGLFFYDCEHQFANMPTRITQTCKQWNGYVNNLSFGPDYFMKYWDEGQPNGDRGRKYRLYKIDNLSFGYFISNLIEDVYLQNKGIALPESLSKIMYPIEETKEAHCRHTIQVP